MVRDSSCLLIPLHTQDTLPPKKSRDAHQQLGHLTGETSVGQPELPKKVFRVTMYLGDTRDSIGSMVGLSPSDFPIICMPSHQDEIRLDRIITLHTVQAKERKRK